MRPRPSARGGSGTPAAPRPAGPAPRARAWVSTFSAIAFLLCLLSCAGGPDPATTTPAGGSSLPLATGPGGGAGSSVGSGSAGQAPTGPNAAGGSATAAAAGAPLAVSPAGQGEREKIEAAIIFGSPSSLARAFGLIAAATGLRAEDARSLAWVAARVAIVVYPDTSESMVPADFRSSADIPSDRLARMAADVLAGRASEIAPADAGKPLYELLPALAVFRSDSRETARRAQAALERFDRLGAVSILPGLVRALEAERQSSWTEARDRYAAAFALAGDLWPAAVGGARARLALGEPEAALALVEPVYKELGPLPSLRKPRAQALYDSGRFAEAEPATALVLRDDPLDARFVLMRAHVLVSARSFQQALPLLDAYATVNPNSRLFLILRATVAEGLRNKDDALRWARRALQSFPDDAEILALAARQLLSPSPNVPGGVEAAKEEGRSLALQAWERGAAALPPGRAPSRQGVIVGTGKPETLALAGAEAARLLFLDAVARYDWPSASTWLDRARPILLPEDRSAQALTLRRASRWPEALDQATLWYQEGPDSEAAAEAYLRALIGSGNQAAAQDLIARLAAAKPSGRFRSVLSLLQSRLATNEEVALGFLRTALIDNPDNAEALTAFYDIYYRRRDFQRARFYLKQAQALQPADPEIQRRARELDASGP